MYSKQPSEARVQVSNLLNCAIMCDVEFSFYDVDDLALLASDLLDQFRDRGMNETIQRRVLDTAHQTNNLEKLRGLVAKFKASIEAHDAKVAKAQAALAAHESQAMEQCQEHTSFSASSFSTAIPSSGATNGSPNGTEDNTNANSQESQKGAVPRASSCTIKVGRPYISHPQRVSLVAAARLSNAGRKPSEAIRCLQEAFRQYAFDEGIKSHRTGNIERVTIRALLESFKELHREAPPSLKSVIHRTQWLEAVRENDISKLVLSRTVPVVKTVHTIVEKLEKRPEMKYLFDWCIEWIRSERAHLRDPTFTGMANEWDRRRAQGDAFYKQRGPRYAQNCMCVSWTQLLDYEQRAAGSALAEQGGSDSYAEEGVYECRSDDAEPCPLQSLDSGAPGAACSWAAEPNGLDGGAPAAADAASAAADAASAAAADSGAGGGTSPASALSAATVAAAAAASAASAAAADSGAERPPQIQNSATAAAAGMPPATPTAADDGGGGGESPDTEYAADLLAAQAAAGAPPSGPLRIADAAVSADAAAVGVLGFSNLNPDGLDGGVPAAAYARAVTRDGDTSAAGHPVVASPTAPAATLPAFPTSAAGAASAEVAAPSPPAPLPPASPTAPGLAEAAAAGAILALAAEVAAAESGLRSAPVAAGPAGAAGGSTPLAPAPHEVSIATVIQIGRAIPRTAASIIRYLWKALCFWGFSLFRYRAAISDSL